MKKLFLLLILVLLSACRSSLVQTNDGYLEISPQATIELTRSVSVPANSARAYFQGGELLSHSGINLYEVDCEIEVNTVSEQRQTIAPGIFRVIAVAQEESPIVRRDWRKPVQLAALNFAWADDSPVDVKLYYQFKLAEIKPQSGAQVRAVICRGAQDDPYNARLPTYEEMHFASGDYLKFNF